jgi:hypothetical protein
MTVEADKLAEFHACSDRLFHRVIDSHALPAGKLVYHYTSIDGLIGIVTSNCLHMTHSRYLNDPGELKYAEGVLAEAVSLAKSSDIPTARLEQVEQIATTYLETQAIHQLPYLACFCNDDNLLSQWRGYAGLAGYALGFDLHDLVQNSAIHDPGGRISVARVEYDRKHQIEIANLWIKYMHRMIEISEYQTTEDMQTHFQTAEHTLQMIVATQKHPDFCEEKEWRLICHSGGQLPTKYKPGFRSPRPYVEYQTAQDKMLPIKRIVTGPGVDAEASRGSIGLMLESHGFDLEADAIAHSTTGIRS